MAQENSCWIWKTVKCESQNPLIPPTWKSQKRVLSMRANTGVTSSLGVLERNTKRPHLQNWTSVKKVTGHCPAWKRARPWYHGESSVAPVKDPSPWEMTGRIWGATSSLISGSGAVSAHFSDNEAVFMKPMPVGHLVFFGCPFLLRAGQTAMKQPGSWQ